jgi:hypothetical protein
MKLNPKKLLLIFSLFLVNYGYSQEAVRKQKYEKFSWESPNKWQGAVFDVPTWFAKDMLYTGREVIRFHEGFYDEKPVGYWSYAFALLVDQIHMPTTQELIDETQRYFVGLVRALGDKSQISYPKNKIIIKPTSNWYISKDNKSRKELLPMPFPRMSLAIIFGSN